MESSDVANQVSDLKSFLMTKISKVRKDQSSAGQNYVLDI